MRRRPRRLFGRRRQKMLEGAMRDLAQAFIDTCARVGHPLERSVASARGIDAAVAALLDERLTPAKVGGVVRGAAAYLGEVIVGQGSAAWALTPGTEHAVIAMLPDGEPVLNLVTVVDRRIRPSRPETLAQFVDRCLVGLERPPEPAPPPTPTPLPDGEPPTGADPPAP